MVTPFIRHNMAGIMCAIAIMILSLAPLPDEPPLEDVPFIDKWVHFVMYGGLAFWMWFDRSWRYSHAALLFPIILGGLMELAQACTTYRSGDWLDFWADTFGVILFTVPAILITKACGRKP